MGKSYRFAFRVTNAEETPISYDLIPGENEQDARAKFYELQELRLKLRETHGSRENFWDLRSNPWFEILAVDELHPATITERPEGAHLSTIPHLKRLPSKSLVIRPVERACCEWGWVHKVLWDGDGHELHDSLSVVGCRSYMEIPLRWPPFYVLESADGALGVCLCPQHLAENFPQWKKMRLGPSTSVPGGERNGLKSHQKLSGFTDGDSICRAKENGEKLANVLVCLNTRNKA